MSRGESEPMRLMPEWAGSAAIPPEVVALFPPGKPAGVGVNEGMVLMPEMVLDLSQQPLPDQPAATPIAPPPAVVDGMAALIGQLSEPTRTVLRLRLDGKSPSEIAGQLGVPELDVRHRLRDGLIDLRGLFHDYQRRLLAG